MASLQPFPTLPSFDPKSSMRGRPLFPVFISFEHFATSLFFLWRYFVSLLVQSWCEARPAPFCHTSLTRRSFVLQLHYLTFIIIFVFSMSDALWNIDYMSSRESPTRFIHQGIISDPI